MPAILSVLTRIQQISSAMWNATKTRLPIQDATGVSNAFGDGTAGEEVVLVADDEIDVFLEVGGRHLQYLDEIQGLRGFSLSAAGNRRLAIEAALQI